MDKDLRPIRVEVLRSITNVGAKARLVVDEATGPPAPALAARLSTISELVVLACYALWDHGPADELKKRLAKSPGSSPPDVLSQIANEIRKKADAHDPRIPLL